MVELRTFNTAYQRATKCVGGPRPGAVALYEYLLAEVDKLPGAQSARSGVYACRSIRGGRGKSVHSEGRAIDVGTRHADGRWPTSPIPEPGLMKLWDHVMDNAAHLGVQYIIFDRKARKPGQGWKYYGGTSPHNDHAHIETTREAAEALTPAYVAGVLGGRTFGENMGTDEYRRMIMADLEIAFFVDRGRWMSSEPGPDGRSERGAWWALLLSKSDPGVMVEVKQDFLKSLSGGVVPGAFQPYVPT